MIGIIILGLMVLLATYLWHASRALYYPGPEAAKMASPLWTRDEILQAYEKAERSPRDITPLPQKQGRRYIIVGGSGKDMKTFLVCFNAQDGILTERLTPSPAR